MRRNRRWPHEVTVQVRTKTPDGGGGFTESWTDAFSVSGLMDTPSSSDIFRAQQMNYTLDRNFIYEYRKDTKAGMRIIFEEETYEVSARPRDQGGKHEIMQAPLKLVPNG